MSYLRDMLPSFAIKNVADVCKRNGILSSQGFSGCAVIELLPDVNDLLFGQLGKVNSFAANGAAFIASLANHVRNVVSSRAEEKVIGINAGWVVALVQHAKFASELAMRQLIRNAVRSILLVLNIDNAVAVPISGSSPFPTVIKDAAFDFGPETLGCAWGKTRGGGMLDHVNSPFVTLTTPPNDAYRCGGNSLPISIIPQEIGI